MARSAIVGTIVLAASMVEAVSPPPAFAAPPAPRCAVGAIPVAAGAEQSFALDADGTVWAAGERGLGVPGALQQRSAIPIPDLTGVVGLDSSGGSSAAVTRDGAAFTWGFGPMLGLGTTVNQERPVRVALETVRQVSVGQAHMLALRTDGTVWSWGDNDYGQLGVGDTADRLVPVQVPGLTGVRAVVGGLFHSLALMGDGSVRAWGKADYGELGIGPQIPNGSAVRTAPVAVPGLSGVSQIDAGRNSLALTGDGAVRSWGTNFSGESGLANPEGGPAGPYIWSPTRIPGLPAVKAISAGGAPFSHTLALSTSGEVWSFGADTSGQLGYPPVDPIRTTFRPVPARVPGFGGVITVDAGHRQSAALTGDGRLWFWGSGMHNGDGSGAARHTPFPWAAARQEAPAVPADLQAAAGPRLAYLLWTPPAQTVTQYVLTRFDNGTEQAPQVLDPPKATAIVRDLSQPVTSAFTVAAQNCLGTSAPTPRSEPVAPYADVRPDDGFSTEGERLTDRLETAVDPFTGNLAVAATDVRINGIGVDLEIGRVHNSLLRLPGSILGGWQSSLVEELTSVWFNQTETVTYRSATGSVLQFTRRPDGTYVSPAGIDAELTVFGAGFAITRDSDGLQHVFSRTPDQGPGRFQLVAIKDRLGNWIRFVLNADGTVDDIQDTQGRVISLDYSGGRLTSIADPTGRRWTYEYDGTGAMVVSVDPAGHRTRYTMNSAGLISRIDTPGGRAMTVSYDLARRVTSLTDPLSGATTRYRYVPSQDGSTTVVTDANGRDTTYAYDPAGRALGVTDGLGNQTRAGYTSRSNVASVTSPTGGTTRYDYDNRRNLTAVRTDTGATQQAAFADGVNPHSPTTVTDPQANPRTFTYGAAGQMMSARAPLPRENQVTASYNVNGTMADTRDARGHLTTFGYDPAGNLAVITPPAPMGATTMSYDALGRLTRTVDGAGRSRTAEYDTMDRVTSVTDGSGAREVRRYDPDGNQIGLDTAEGATVIAYDGRNRLLSQQTPDGRLVRYGYDLVGNLNSYDDGTGQIFYGYNAANLLSSVQEPNGATTRMSYDGAYNRTVTTFPNNTQITSTYDRSNREITRTATRSGATLFTDVHLFQGGAGQPADSMVRRGLTENGLAQITSSYSYDGANRLIRATTDVAPNPSLPEAESWARIFTYRYDGNGNMVSETIESPAGDQVNTLMYDAANQLISRNGVSYTYDGAGNLTGSTDGARYSYNAAGQTVAITPPIGTGTATEFTYRGVSGQAERTTRTTNGVNSLSVTGAFGVTSDHTASAIATTFLREPSGALLGQNGPDGRHYYLTDSQGSVRWITDGQSGERAVLFRYSPYGEAVSTVARSQADAELFRWRWQGQYLDLAGVYHIGQRYYNVATHRWTQPDPLRSGPFDPLNSNVYVYAGSDPVNNTDRNGLFVEDLFKVIRCGAAIVGAVLSIALPINKIGKLVNKVDDLAGPKFWEGVRIILGAGTEKERRDLIKEMVESFGGAALGAVGLVLSTDRIIYECG